MIYSKSIMRNGALCMYYITEKMDGYYRIGSPENVFCYLIEGTEKAALIDTGYGYGDLKEIVRKITDKQLIIFNTHGHVDHTCGNALFEEECRIGEKDINLCRKHTSAQFRRESIERAKHSMNYETGEIYNALPEGFNAEEYCRRGAGNLKPVKDGEIFELGNVTLKVYETPGHTQGGISILYEQKNLLFIGDATGMFVWLFSEETTDLATYIKAVRKMYDLDCCGYIGAHNPNIMQRDELLLFIQAAEKADYDSGEPFENFLDMKSEPRVCGLNGMKLDEMFHSGYASVVIGKNKKRICEKC